MGHVEDHTSQHLHDRQLELKFIVSEVGDRWIHMLFNSSVSIQVRMKLSLNPTAKEPSMEALSPENHQGRLNWVVYMSDFGLEKLEVNMQLIKGSGLQMRNGAP